MARNRGRAQYLGFQCPIDTPGIPVIKPWKPMLIVLPIHMLFNSEPKVVTSSLLVSRKNSESCFLCLTRIYLCAWWGGGGKSGIRGWGLRVMFPCPLPGSTAPCYLPPMASADPSTLDSQAGSWGPQDIQMEKSVLRRVQMGHGNEMRLHSNPAKGSAHSACDSPPGNRTVGCHPAPTPPHLASSIHGT